MSQFLGQGYYCKYEGVLIESGDMYREVLKGEVWEGSEEDYNQTFIN